MTSEIAASAWELEGGFSHALMETINAIRRTMHAKKSYAIISIAPFQGLRLTAYRLASAFSIVNGKNGINDSETPGAW